MLLDKIVSVMKENEDCIAIVTDDVEYSYKDLLDYYEKYMDDLMDIPENSVFAVRGKFTVKTIGLMMALINRKSIYVPIAKEVVDVDFCLKTAQCEYFIDMEDEKIQNLSFAVSHPILVNLKEKGLPGIVFFSSGTTGVPKAAVHDLMPYIHRFEERGKTLRSMAFLLFDHMGGFNTVMHSISNGGFMVTLSQQTPDEVCRVIEKYKLELLPTSPTFLNMLLMGRYNEKYDLSSLKIISYGTEPMPESTLNRLHKLFP